MTVQACYELPRCGTRRTLCISLVANTSVAGQSQVQDRIERFGGAGVPLVFAHANGYPPGSYRALLEPLTAEFSVFGYRHRPLWSSEPAPPRADWHLFARDMNHALAHTFEKPVWLMGHSLGGVVSLLAAIREPERYRGLVLLDPVFLGWRQALGLNFTPRGQLKRLPMIRSALRRPEQFADRQEAFDFHRGKRAFRGLSDAVLWDYIEAGTKASGEGVRLAWSGAWEAAVYASVPLVWPRLRRLQLPTLGLRGEHSDILTPRALQRWRQLQPNAELDTLPGGHLFPLEDPVATADRVLQFLRGLA